MNIKKMKLLRTDSYLHSPFMNKERWVMDLNSHKFDPVNDFWNMIKYFGQRTNKTRKFYFWDVNDWIDNKFFDGNRIVKGFDVYLAECYLDVWSRLELIAYDYPDGLGDRGSGGDGGFINLYTLKRKRRKNISG